MKMKFLILSKLLHSGSYQLFSGYIVFSLSILIILFKFHTFWQYSLIIIAMLLVAIHHYVALRVKLDAELLEYLSKTEDAQQLEQLTQELDQSLVTLKLMPEQRTGRSWDLRLKGCQKLFKWQISLLVLQFVYLIIVLVPMF
ncbi:hypothetical protein [Acinetobacter shaoyimingii]|uniref:Uncharacterized protein n=1 Tax=Acinetobacter shaoyimingii TaxID=2715164 RepID=A0A6G8RUZ0_9GAMM|nr:hypothetical protein [Acinetobacter shaoyimingii]QIO05752.1 hypothetical protein G8E00_07215 [Acinetobacter shaoyimingii]